MGVLDGCAHRFEAFEVQIDRPRTDGAAAGSRHPGLAETSLLKVLIPEMTHAWF